MSTPPRSKSIGAPLGLLLSWSIVTMGALAVPSIAAGQAFTWSGGVDVTNGDYYFSERTTAVWLSNGLVFRQGALWVDASLPVLAQNSDAVTRVAGLPIPTGGSRSGDVAGRGDGSGSGSGGGGSSSDPLRARLPQALGTMKCHRCPADSTSNVQAGKASLPPQHSSNITRGSPL